MNTTSNVQVQLQKLCFKIFAFTLLVCSFSILQAQETGCYTIKNEATNAYLSHGGPLLVEYYANRDNTDAWEKFYLTKLSDGKHTIYGEDGKFLSAQSGVDGVASFVWKAGAANDWEKWNIGGNLIESHHGTQLFTAIGGRVMVVDWEKADALAKKFQVTYENVANGGEHNPSSNFNWTIEAAQGCKVPPTNILNPPFTPDHITVNSSADCVPIPQANNPIANLTVEAWVNNSSPSNGIQAIVSATDGSFVHLQTSADNNVNCVVYLDNGEAIMLPVIPTLTANKWHHVAIVAESGNSRIYLDGKQVGAVNPTTFNGIKPSNSVFIGKGWEGQRVFKGKMAGVRVWDRAFTPAEIYANYTSIPTNLNGLIFQR